MGIGTLPWELHTLYKDPAQSPNLCPMEGDEMTVQQYYAAIGADYNEVIRRLGNEDRIRRFLLKFPADQSFSILCHSLAENQYEEAFRAAHSLKGISMNLGLTPLQSPAAQSPKRSAPGLPPRISARCSPNWKAITTPFSPQFRDCPKPRGRTIEEV